MASFKEAYLDLAAMVAEAAAATGLSEETLIDLFKTQLVYGQAPITQSVAAPEGEYIGGPETDFSEESDDDEDDSSADILPFPVN